MDTNEYERGGYRPAWSTLHVEFEDRLGCNVNVGAS